MGVGVYIPNMEKPKFCKCEEYNCFAWDDEKYKCKITEWKKPCPLIEIDLVRCGECIYRHEHEWYNTCDKHIGHGFEDDYFCKDGERRADNERL